MKFINSVNGTVGLRVSGDDVMPEQGVNSRDLIDLLIETYKFAVRPQVPPGVPASVGNLVFQSGICVINNERLPIVQLASVVNGDLVTATTTEIADRILDDYTQLLNEKLGYRFSSTKQRKSYQSNIVVQFSHQIEEKLQVIGQIGEFLQKEIPRDDPFKLKRVSFGYGNIIQMLTLETLEKSDFAFERRGEEPYSENRWFCVAPVSTSEHIRILEALEHQFMGS